MWKAFAKFDWKSIMTKDEIEDNYVVFLEKYIEICNNFVTKPPWITRDLEELIKKKKRLWLKFKATDEKNRELQIE